METVGFRKEKEKWRKMGEGSREKKEDKEEGRGKRGDGERVGLRKEKEKKRKRGEGSKGREQREKREGKEEGRMDRE